MATPGRRTSGTPAHTAAHLNGAAGAAPGLPAPPTRVQVMAPIPFVVPHTVPGTTPVHAAPKGKLDTVNPPDCVEQTRMSFTPPGARQPLKSMQTGTPAGHGTP